MRKILLMCGKTTLVDSDMYFYLNRFHWSYHHGYAVRNERTSTGKRYIQSMHHLVIGIVRIPKELGLETDHINGDRLDNRRNNLRVVSPRQNSQNKKCHRAGKTLGCSKMKGRRLSKPWIA